MSHYRRVKTQGAKYFFTVVTKYRHPWFASAQNIDILRAAFRKTMDEKPFRIDAVVILPDHLHCIWHLPEGDSDYSSRWREIKKRTSRYLAPETNGRKERPVWQRRFWEHQIRNDKDWHNHMDYIHYNPIKHGLVDKLSDWPWSSFHRAVAHGWYEPNWDDCIPQHIADMDHE